MKNLTKIFTTVVAGMFAFSCVTDTTEDLGIQIVGGGKTTNEVTLSMEAARTHLGEKADGVYPLYWSEGDAISVNGAASDPLTGVGTEAATAVFKFAEGVTTPLCVVYPAAAVAAAEEVVEGEETPAPTTVYPVNFLATQPYTVGTFAPQAAPMYGYAATPAEGEELEAVQMQHLTGVLRLAISGNGEKVTGIAVRAQNGKIAGAFTVDCTNGTLTAVEASNTVNVTFDGGLVLGDEATPIYLTIPAGKYGTFVITVTTEAHEKMTLKFNSDVKPINAGIVREFTAFTYEANTNDSEDIFIIDSEDKLVEFAKIASVFYPRTKAQVTATLDMSDYEWKPIEGFGAYEFDGGSEEGCEIQGLNAPLFGTTNAAISNVKLTNVNYTVTDLAHSGAIACNLNDGSLSNCSVSGTININNTTLASAAASYTGICHAGLVGFASAATFTNCTNDADITISSLCEASKSITSTVGGVVGGVTDGCALTYITNNGDITYAGTTQKANCYISGIVGKNSDVADNGVADFVSLSNCTNNGKISSTAGCKSTGNLLMSGITGRVMIDVNTVCNLLVNNGTITHNGSCASATIGGIAAYDSQGTFTNCSNTAALSIADGSSVSSSSTVCGLFGSNVTTGGMNECHNTGSLYVGDGKTAATGKLTMAGVANVVTVVKETLPEIKNCTNSATITLGQWTNPTVTGNGGRALVGGVFQSINAGKVSKCYNQATGTISVNTGEMGAIHMIGGVAAYISSLGGNPVLYISECENKANITVNSTAAVGNAEIGGFVGEAYLNNHTDAYSVDMRNCKNSGNVTVSATYTGNPQIGGLYGINNYDTIVLTSCENSGNVTFNGTAPYVHLGGIIGYDGANFAFTVDGCVNKGVIKVTSVVTSGARIGGIVGTYNKDYTSATIVKNCTNLGTVALEGEQTKSSAAYDYCLGGILGLCSDTLFTIEDCTNGYISDAGVIDTTKGIVTAGTAPSGIGVGGMVGISTAAITIDGCNNYGHISQTGKGGKDGTYRPHIAGMIGQCSKFLTVTDCTNYGIVEYGPVQSPNKADVGGIVGETSTSGGMIRGCNNAGTVRFTAPTGAETNVAGIIGMAQAGTTVENCRNLEGAVVTAQGKIASSSLCVGGIAGSTNSGTVKLLHCYNYGTVEQTHASSAGTLYIGGIDGYPYVIGLMQYCGNHGPVTAKSASNIYQGGLGGRPRTGDSGNVIKDCYNAYDLTFSGKATSYYAGGLIGHYGKNKEKVPTLENLINLGNLTFAATGTLSTIYFGGVMGGTTNGAVNNCQCYANIKGIGMEGKVGLIMCQARADATKAANCKIGGNLIFSETTTEEEDANGGDPVTVITPNYTPIAADNWFNYIYNGAVTEEVATDDGCELLTAKPAIPVYTYTPAQ